MQEVASTPPDAPCQSLPVLTRHNNLGSMRKRLPNMFWGGIKVFLALLCPLPNLLVLPRVKDKSIFLPLR